MNEPVSEKNPAVAPSGLSAGLEVKAAAFDALVKMLTGRHREVYPVRRRYERKEDGTGFIEIPVHTFQWIIEIEGSTDVEAGVLKLVSSNVEVRGCATTEPTDGEKTS